MRAFRFVDLFAGLGGFHVALKELGHECVFASEIDAELQELYRANFEDADSFVFGDIRQYKNRIPAHDILCAGFPCQPFSKSGDQKGMRDKTRGTLFHEIMDVLKKHEPKYVFLENVGNFERHDEGRTWRVVRRSLEGLGYNVRGTEHVASGGHGLISPHHFGFPHNRDRFFIVATKDSLLDDPFPRAQKTAKPSLASIVQSRNELSEKDIKETALLPHYIECIHHWNTFLGRLPESVELPSFPIWGDEILASYPYKKKTPYSTAARELLRHVSCNGFAGHRTSRHFKSKLLSFLPSYARTEQKQFPRWKIAFIEQNREWFDEVIPYMPDTWIHKLKEFPPSLRKLEWNCQGEEPNLWRHLLQFRPSGLRVKRYTTCPSLVAMTTTQIPILGPKRRYITRIEGLRLQGFPDDHKLPLKHEDAFRALGNAVHVGVLKRICSAILSKENEPVTPSHNKKQTKH